MWPELSSSIYISINLDKGDEMMIGRQFLGTEVSQPDFLFWYGNEKTVRKTIRYYAITYP